MSTSQEVYAMILERHIEVKLVDVVREDEQSLIEAELDDLLTAALRSLSSFILVAEVSKRIKYTIS